MRAQVHVQAALAKAGTLADGTLRLTFDTQEITPEQLTALLLMAKHTGHLAFAPDPVGELTKPVEHSAEVHGSSYTPSQRLRLAFKENFIKVHHGDPKDREGFEKFYEEEMLHLIKLVNEFTATNNERGFW